MGVNEIRELEGIVDEKRDINLSLIFLIFRYEYEAGSLKNNSPEKGKITENKKRKMRVIVKVKEKCMEI